MADVIRPFIGERVLEIGAGAGNLTLQLIPRKLYYASDINPHYLTYLKNLIPDHPYLRVGYTDGERHDSYPSDEKFDTVICLNVVEHLENEFRACEIFAMRWRKMGARSFWSPAGPRYTGRWIRSSGIIAATPKRNLRTSPCGRAFNLRPCCHSIGLDLPHGG